uniref:ubiquitinyl hydrolase 1 n=1 Tax=Urocitellus parryii TaxID=9999 RepID=A0A8D2IMP9_UROPR
MTFLDIKPRMTTWQGNLVVTAPGDMEAASLHCGGESQFHDCIKPECSSNAADAKAHLCPSLPAESSLPPCPDTHLNKASAPVGPLLAPRGKLCLNWQRLSAAGAGLQNMGNTCYVNAALQCLTYTPPLANYMLSQEHCQRCPRHRVCMLCVMQAHVTQALRHPGDIIQPLPALVAAFHKSQQEDSHEFLLFILNAVQKVCLHGHMCSDILLS